jgi:hypothetical protein
VSPGLYIISFLLYLTCRISSIRDINLLSGNSVKNSNYLIKFILEIVSYYLNTFIKTSNVYLFITKNSHFVVHIIVPVLFAPVINEISPKASPASKTLNLLNPGLSFSICYKNLYYLINSIS